ncbi:MAG TPA: tryptophan 2,3-dioxygenase family protein [Gaiellaceae bacterium]|nr:tryptophan 2,3-dioxygenase family protein [Gaiellaceae bacterium]
MATHDATEVPPGHGSDDASEEDYSPILPGQGASDYERYLRTDELLALQKPPEERAHPDELLFQTVHQTGEIWLKLACSEVERATEHLRAQELAAAIRLLRRSTEAMKIVVDLMDMLEHMSPWEYTRWIRPVLGHGSGFDSPGFNAVRRVSPELGSAFHELRREAGLSIIELYQRGREFEELYQLAELLTEWDEWVTLWRIRHFKVVERVIGGHVVGTQGTPVELLEGLIHRRHYPELWDARNELTELAKQEE